jgi:hypothetical protein
LYPINSPSMKKFIIFSFISLCLVNLICSQIIFVTQEGAQSESPDKAYGWNWLYTGTWGVASQTNIGLDGAGIWYAAIILNLSDHIGDSIIKVGYYHKDSATVTAKIYTGNYQNPLVQVGQSIPYTFTVAGWKQDILLQNPVAISAPALYWIILEVQDPGANYYPIGSRAPLNQNAGKISVNGTVWNDLSFYSINNSWLLGAYVYNSCPPPKNLSVSQVGPYNSTVKWNTQGGTIPMWQIEYGFSGFLPGTGLTVSTADTSYMMTNLQHSTQYQYYVRAVCGQGDTSLWAGPGSFETLYVNDKAEFLNYYFGYAGEIDIINDPYIFVTIASSPNLSNLVAHFSVSSGVREIKVNGIDQISGQTLNNFYQPVVYSILAEDSVTMKNWIVVVNGFNNLIEISDSDFFIFPNPCTDYFEMFAPEGSELTITDVFGKHVMLEKIHKNFTVVGVHHLPKGTYLLKVKTKGTEMIRKIVIQ